MITIYHAISDTNIGGAGKVLLQIIKQSDPSQFKHTVILPKNSMLLQLFENTPAKIIPFNGMYDYSFSMIDVWRLYKLFIHDKPDIFSSNACLSGRIAAYLSKVPTRINIKHCFFESPKKLKNKAIKRLKANLQMILSTNFVGVSEIVCSALANDYIDKSRITKIVNKAEILNRASIERAASLRKSLNINKNSFVIGIMARLEAYKGHLELIYAFKEILEENPNIYLICPGDGSQKDNLKKIANSISPDHIIFPGFVEDTSLWYSIMDLYINNSYGTEAASISIEEAQSLGLPIIATDYGGNTELIKNNYNGLIIPHNNTQALKNAIKRILVDEELRARISTNAKNEYHKNINSMINGYEQLWLKEYYSKQN